MAMKIDRRAFLKTSAAMAVAGRCFGQGTHLGLF